jgi:hypothetical protein
MSSEIKTKGIPHKKLRPLIEKVRNRVRQHPVVQKMFKKYKVDLEEIELIPMCFADLDVSARTDHGVMYFSTKLLEDGDFDKDDHYLVHEMTHFLQQTTGDKPTPGSDEGEYLDNPAEKEGFQNQSEYLAETRGDLAAEKYVNQVLNHHDVKGKSERRKRRIELLELAREE